MPIPRACGPQPFQHHPNFTPDLLKRLKSFIELGEAYAAVLALQVENRADDMDADRPSALYLFHPSLPDSDFMFATYSADARAAPNHNINLLTLLTVVGVEVSMPVPFIDPEGCAPLQVFDPLRPHIIGTSSSWMWSPFTRVYKHLCNRDPDLFELDRRWGDYDIWYGKQTNPQPTGYKYQPEDDSGYSGWTVTREGERFPSHFTEERAQEYLKAKRDYYEAAKKECLAYQSLCEYAPPEILDARPEF